MQSGWVILGSALGAIAIEVGMGAYFWRERDRFRGGRWFIAAILTALLGAVFFLGQLLAPTPAVAVFWSQLVGIAGLGTQVAIFGFAATYTHRAWLLQSRWFHGLLAALLAVYAIRLTTDLPGWPGLHTLWASGATTPVRGGVQLVEFAHEPVYYAYVGVVGAWLVVVAALLVEFTLRPSQRLYRLRNAAVTVGIGTPALAAIAAETVAAGFEVTVPGVAIALLLIGTALSRYGALDAPPIARTGVVDEIEGGVVVFDDDQRVVDVTTRAREVLDAPEAAPGEELATLLGDRLEGLDETDGALPDRLDGETYRVAGEERRFVETRVSTLTDGAGAELSRALLLYDVTDRVDRERELERKNEFLDEFAGVVSHDIATPLSTIENKARLVELTDETDHVTDIYDATERVQSLVDEMRLVARQGHEVGETEAVDVGTVAREAWQTAGRSQDELVVADSRTIQADRRLLGQIFENLLSNAVEHGSGRQGDAGRPDGGVPAERTAADADGVTVRVGTTSDGFYVADDGPGIPPADRERVFDQGYSGDADGSGLGLAIVRLIAEAHGWEISVTEARAGGARFEIATGE